MIGADKAPEPLKNRLLDPTEPARFGSDIVSGPPNSAENRAKKPAERTKRYQPRTGLGAFELSLRGILNPTLKDNPAVEPH